MAIEEVDWQTFASRFRWRQGEHVAAIAPTGAGKTTLMKELMPLRKYSIFMGTKKDDKLYHEILATGFQRVNSIEEIKPWMDKILLWPRHGKTIRQTYGIQANAFREAFDMVVNQKAWTVWADECKYMAEHLRLAPELTFCLEQLRSINGTTVSGAQRPVWLPKSVLSNSTHVFLWKTTDREDARRLSDIGGIDSRDLAKEAKALGKHEFIYIYTRGTETQMLRSQVRRK